MTETRGHVEWTPQMDRVLRTGWSANWTASQIVTAVDIEHGTTASIGDVLVRAEQLELHYRYYGFTHARQARRS